MGMGKDWQWLGCGLLVGLLELTGGRLRRWLGCLLLWLPAGEAE